MATTAEPATVAAPVRATRALSRPVALGLVGIAGLVLAVVAGVGLGSVAVSPVDTIAVLGRHLLGLPAAGVSPAVDAIVWDLRLPRVLTTLVVGLGLAVAGTTFQGLLRNPLADPYVLGTASGAALGAAIAVVVPVRVAILEFGLLNALAFVGAVGAIAAVYRLARTGGLGAMTNLLLTGYATGALLAAGLALAMYLSGSALRQIFGYLLGSFADASWARLGGALVLVVAGTVPILLRARSLNALLLGEEAAEHLGIDVRRERRTLLALGSLVTAASVAVSGLIGFVGLVVPHVVRLAVGPNARLVLPLAAIYGALLMAVADLVARLLGEIPVGVVTAVVGAPFFLFLLRRARAGYEL